MRIWKALIATVLVSASSFAGATTITYNVTQIDPGTNTWQYDYSIANDTLASAISEITIFFDETLYSNLSIIASAPLWDSLVIQPDAGSVPPSGYFDTLLVDGLAPGATLGGFSVSFVYLGAGTPGVQSFDVVDPDSFATIASGRTEPPRSTNVPEPGTLLLLGLGLLALGLRKTKRVFSA